MKVKCPFKWAICLLALLILSIAPSRAWAEECTQIRLVLAQDQTGSDLANRTPLLTVSDLRPLIEAIVDNPCGGEIALELIRDVSTQPLLRLFVSPRPAMPVAFKPDSNPFRTALARQQYDRELAVATARLNAWKTETDGAIKHFDQAAAIVLNQASDARRTDIFNPIHRAAAFLSEQGGKGSTRNATSAATQFLVLISDCEDNVNAPMQSIPPSVSVVVVNGMGATGSLGRLGITPVVFESWPPAARWIVERTRR
jgi:hypothetical protein